ncbi:SUF system NifU family Fe-S cluster assembly protein [Candidatus Woesearchaeota archaeon]|nr:SUF system NifU family Fe-S cluster assembly protein [Candidatus Woesearchaeota archaeon]
MKNTSEAMYREHILSHYKEPQHFGSLQHATHHAHSFNPLCGDDLTMELLVKKQQVEDVRFSGKGCAISMAAASMLTEIVVGKTIDQLKKLTKDDIFKLLDIPLSPGRIKCALLCLETLHKAAYGEQSKGDKGEHHDV